MKAKNNSNLKNRTTTNGLIYRTQLEGILNKFDKQSNRHSTKGSTQIEPREWHYN